MKSKYPTRKPFRTKRETKRDQELRDLDNRIAELETDKETLQKALSARLEPAPVTADLGTLQRLLDNLRAVMPEIMPNSISERAMNAILALRGWGRPPAVSGGFQEQAVVNADWRQREANSQVHPVIKRQTADVWSVLAAIKETPGMRQSSLRAEFPDASLKDLDAIVFGLVKMGKVVIGPDSGLRAVVRETNNKAEHPCTNGCKAWDCPNV